MNIDHLKRDVGYRVKIVPAAYHLDAVGDPLPFQDEDWIIIAVTDEYVEISTDAGHFYRLGKDHVRSFATDPHRSAHGAKRGFLQLNVQLYVSDTGVSAVPNHQPGAAVPPPVDLTLRARATFVPELERVFRRQIQILDRIIVNFSVTANDLVGIHQPARPGDTWKSLLPFHPGLFPNAPTYRDLPMADAALLAEFYGAIDEVHDLIDHWTDTIALTEYNAWNVLMHKVQHSLKMGELAVQKLCPDRAYDATMPGIGTLLSRSQKALSDADKARSHMIARYEASKAVQSGARRR